MATADPIISGPSCPTDISFSDLVMLMAGNKQCLECRKIKALSSFHVAKGTPSGRKARCSDCESTRRMLTVKLGVALHGLNEIAWRHVKYCPRCDTVLPKNMFYPSKKKSGLTSRCKQCNIEISHEYQQKNKLLDRSISSITYKKCSRCQQVLSVQEFCKVRSYKDGYSCQCRKCSKEIFHQWYEDNIERERERSRRWYQDSPANLEIHRDGSRRWRENYPERMIASVKNWKARNPELDAEFGKRRRARKKNAPVVDLTPAQWAFIKKYHHFRCYYCGKKSKRLTRDHIVSFARGGSHSMDNIVPACRSCNSKKGPRPAPIPVQPLLKLGIV